jgi:hypothetical protein
MRLWLFVLAALAVVGNIVWLSDKVTLQGERTIYTVDCRDGAWQELRCTGRLVAAERFRFRALKPHREVVFWTVGATEPSGKFTDCDIEDGRNWVCRPTADAARTITLKMSQGVASRHKSATRSRHIPATWSGAEGHLEGPCGRRYFAVCSDPFAGLLSMPFASPFLGAGGTFGSR